MRDLKADLALCEKATPGPWEFHTNRHPTTRGASWGWVSGPIENWCWTDEGRSSRNDANFIAAAREAWPEAIQRALRAEGILQAILKLTEQGREVKFTEDWGGNTLTIHIDDAHSHVGVPDGSFDDLLESLYQLLVKGCGLSFVRFVKEGKP